MSTSLEARLRDIEQELSPKEPHNCNQYDGAYGGSSQTAQEPRGEDSEVAENPAADYRADQAQNQIHQ